jgi:hypothetical protein
MPKGEPNGHYQMGWRDVSDYLVVLRNSTGKRWDVRLTVTGELSQERYLLLSLCCCGGGKDGHAADCVPTAAHWPNANGRGLAASVWDMCFRADRVLAEKARIAERQASF